MVIVRLWGGLGNQLFQYATALALARRKNCEVKIDHSLLFEKLHDPLTVKREFDLDILIKNYQIASEKDRSIFHPNPKSLTKKLFAKIRLKLKKPNVFIERPYFFNENIYSSNLPVCLVGNFQSFKYFKNEWNSLEKEFAFKEQILEYSLTVAEEIENCNSVCINVRRGDYIWHPEYSKILGFRGLEYILPAIKKMEELTKNPKFFIFSDDLEWCKSELLPKIDGTIIDHKHKGWKFGNYLQLMSKCKHHIIPNSTFAWWAAWLGQKQGQIVIAPQNWYMNIDYNVNDIIPDNWIKI